MVTPAVTSSQSARQIGPSTAAAGRPRPIVQPVSSDVLQAEKEGMPSRSSERCDPSRALWIASRKSSLGLRPT